MLLPKMGRKILLVLISAALRKPMQILCRVWMCNLATIIQPYLMSQAMKKDLYIPLHFVQDHLSPLLISVIIAVLPLNVASSLKEYCQSSVHSTYRGFIYRNMRKLSSQVAHTCAF